MDQFSDLMAAEFQRRVGSIPVAQDRAVASVRAGIRRRRTVRAVVSAAAAVALVGAVGAGSYGVYSHYQADPAIPVSPSPTAQPTEASGAPTPTPHVTVSPSPSTQPGKAITEYPPVAASRGAGFPAAYEMRDWVWDYVGKGWSVQSFSVSQRPYSDTTLEILPSVIYLVSPDGAAFELVTLPLKYSQSLIVLSWQWGEHGAHIAYVDTDSGRGAYGELNLDSGDVSPIVFTTPWGETGSVWQLAASPEGNELWGAGLGDHERYYRFSPADGWTVSSLNSLDGLDDTTAPVRWQTADLNYLGGLGSPDGAAVVFERRRQVARGYEPFPPTQILMYDVNTDTYVLSADNLNMTSPLNSCYANEWAGGDTVQYDCAPFGTGLGVTVQVPGAPDHSAGPAADVPVLTSVDHVEMLSGTIENGRGVIQSGYVGYGESPARPLYVGCDC
jgi:hypothetical protein